MAQGFSVLGFVALFVSVVIIAALVKNQNGHAASQRYAAARPVYARPVLSEVERQLFRRLIEAFPDKLILPQVQLCRFIEVRDVPGRMSVLNRCNRLGG